MGRLSGAPAWRFPASRRSWRRPGRLPYNYGLTFSRALMYYLLTTFYVLVCMMLLLVILLQQGKRGDMGSAFGGCSFFFQAEDGIRDTSVTGVQTCALPI